MHTPILFASLVAAASAARLHIYDVRDTSTDATVQFEHNGIATFTGPPDCDDARSAVIAEYDDNVESIGARCEGCKPVTDTHADLNIEELEINYAESWHYTLYQDEDYQITPADGSPLRGNCWRDSDDDFSCPNFQGYSLSGTRLFICDTDLEPYAPNN